MSFIVKVYSCTNKSKANRFYCMRFIAILIILIPLNSIFLQNECCESFERLKKAKQCFITKYNNDSTNYCLVAVDTITQNPLFEYCYDDKNPLLNLEGDYYNDDYREEWLALFNRSMSRDNNSIGKDSTSKDSKRVVVHYHLRQSKYELRNFDYDSINVEFKELIEYFNFPYCTERLDIKTSSATLPIKENTLQSILTNRTNSKSDNFAIIQNLTSLSSCSGRIVERKLDVIGANGDFYSIIEKYKLNETPVFSYGGTFNGIWSKGFDIIESKSNTFLITYVGKKINLYDLKNERFLKEIDTERNIPYPYKAIEVNDNTIVFIPKPNRRGYDWRNSKYILRGGRDISDIRDYDDTVKRVFVFNLKKDEVYYKDWRVDEIEKIIGFKKLNILLSDNKNENIRKWTKFEN